MSKLTRILGFFPAYLDVPDSWDTVKAKWLFKEVKDTGYSEKPLLSVTQAEGVIPREDSEDRVWNPGNDVSHYKLVEPGQYVISLRSFEGGVEYSSISGIVSPAYVVIDPEPPMERRQGYLQYLFKSSVFIDALEAISSGIRQGKTISFSDFAEMPLPVPPIEWASQQAEFLDLETSKIDRLINKKQRLIELLEERRTALITNSVTKGLDPDVAMKDSGVEWLGEIPENWETTRVGYHVDLINGFPFSSEHFSNRQGIPLIRIRDLGNQDTEAYYTGDPQTEFRVEPGDIVIGMDGDFDVDRWSGEPALLNQRLCCLQTQGSLDDRFLYYCLPAPLNVINDLTHSTTVKHLSSKQVRRIKICYPPIRVQREIGRRLDEKTSSIDHLIARIREAIDSLYEYRSALITAAVTGKIDVRDRAA